MQIIDERGGIQFSVLSFLVIVLVLNIVDLENTEKFFNSGYQVQYHRIITASNEIQDKISDKHNECGENLNNLLSGGKWIVNNQVQQPNSKPKLTSYTWSFKEQVSKQILRTRNSSISWMTPLNSRNLSYNLNNCIPSVRIFVFGDSKSRQMGFALEAVFSKKFDNILDQGSHGNMFFENSGVEFFWCTDIHNFNGLLNSGQLAGKSKHDHVDYVITDSMILHVLAGGSNVTAKHAIDSWEKTIHCVVKK